MTFELLPTLDIMIDLYAKPRTDERFQAYLKILQGDTKGNLIMPIGGFNPMAKEHLLDGLLELKNLGAEQIMTDTIKELNDKLVSKQLGQNIKVALNVSDDLKGGWTNRFTSDYDSKFKFDGLIKRGFCTPILWTSEHFTKDKIRTRTLAYALRTLYWLTASKPKTLKAHLAQEVFVASQVKSDNKIQASAFEVLAQLLHDNQETEEYHIIFNFFYGNKAAKSLAFPTYGMIDDITGFDYATHLAQ